MNVRRIIEVKGRNTLGTVQDFLASLLTRHDVDALFAPAISADGTVGTTLISDPAVLKQVNPFMPVMMANAAVIVAAATMQPDAQRIGAVMRPCEIRALIELSKRGRARLEKVTVIGTDCLGTFDPPEFERRLAEAGDVETMTMRCMQATQSGEFACRTRTACQICERPAPRGADVTLGFIGVDATTELLVIAADESTDRRLSLPEVSDREALEREVTQREAVLADIVRRHKQAADREIARLDTRFAGMAEIIALLSSCTKCRACLRACPLYDGEIDDTSQTLVEQLGAVARWLVSCAGCGMCEEACPNNVPLAVVARSLARPIRDRLHYTPGQSVEDRLPWVS